MPSGVSVESTAVNGGIRCCQMSIQELQTASQSLNRSYRQAGSGGWSDQKYAALGDIVSDCCNALDKPVAELKDCMVKLQELLQAIQDYEQVNL